MINSVLRRDKQNLSHGMWSGTRLQLLLACSNITYSTHHTGFTKRKMFLSKQSFLLYLLGSIATFSTAFELRHMYSRLIRVLPLDLIDRNHRSRPEFTSILLKLNNWAWRNNMRNWLCENDVTQYCFSLLNSFSFLMFCCS